VTALPNETRQNGRFCREFGSNPLATVRCQVNAQFSPHPSCQQIGSNFGQEIGPTDTSRLADVDGHGGDVDAVVLTPGEAAQRLGVTRSRIYALVRQGELDDVGGDSLRVTLASVERRLAASPPAGEPISPLGAWAILALASHDAAFRMHMAGRLSDRDRPRARARLEQRGLLELVPRLRGRAVARRFAADGDALLAILEDPRCMLAGSSAARQLGLPLPPGDWPVELYVPEPDLVELVETHDLELAEDGQCDLVLRAVPEPWPFPPHLCMVPDVVAALDLAEAVLAELAALGRAWLDELAAHIEPSWQRRPQRQRTLRPMIPSGRGAPLPRHRLQISANAGVAAELWDDLAERDGRHWSRCSLWPARRWSGPRRRRRCGSRQAGSSGRVRS
jgi:hypothetical protein